MTNRELANKLVALGYRVKWMELDPDAEIERDSQALRDLEYLYRETRIALERRRECG